MCLNRNNYQTSTSSPGLQESTRSWCRVTHTHCGMELAAPPPPSSSCATEEGLRARAHWPLCLATGGRVFVAGIFIPVGNHYFRALASTLQFVAQMCDRQWLFPATDRAFAYVTYMSPPHVALVCLGPPQKRGHLWLNKVASVLGP